MSYAVDDGFSNAAVVSDVGYTDSFIVIANGYIDCLDVRSVSYESYVVSVVFKDCLYNFFTNYENFVNFFDVYVNY